MRLRRKKCGKPEPANYPLEYLRQIKLPEKAKVEERLGKLVKDEVIRRVLLEILDTIYRMPEDSEFITWIKNDAVRYRVPLNKNAFIDYMAAMPLAFATYCKEEVFKAEKLEDIADTSSKHLDEPACMVIANIMQEIQKDESLGGMSKVKLIKFIRKWWKETGNIIKAWNKIMDRWCEW